MLDAPPLQAIRFLQHAVAARAVDGLPKHLVMTLQSIDVPWRWQNDPAEQLKQRRREFALRGQRIQSRSLQLGGISVREPVLVEFLRLPPVTDSRPEFVPRSLRPQDNDHCAAAIATLLVEVEIDKTIIAGRKIVVAAQNLHALGFGRAQFRESLSKRNHWHNGIVRQMQA